MRGRLDPLHHLPRGPRREPGADQRGQSADNRRGITGARQRARTEYRHPLAGRCDIHPGSGEGECRWRAFGVHRADGQHVVVVPGRTDRDRDVLPGCVGLLSGTLRVAGGISSGRDDDGILDIDRVGQGGAECAVVEHRRGGNAGDRRNVDHRSAEIGGRPDGSRHGLHVADPHAGPVSWSELGTGLADADQGDIGRHAAEAICFGIRCGNDDSGHQGAVRIAILGTVAGGNVVASGHHTGQSRVSRYTGVDDRHSLACAAGELPDLRQVEVRELIRAAPRLSGARTHRSAHLALHGRPRWRRRRRFGQPRLVDRRWRNRLRRRRSELKQRGERRYHQQPNDA